MDIFTYVINTYFILHSAFDPDVAFTDDHKKIHEGYKDMVSVIINLACISWIIEAE